MTVGTPGSSDNYVIGTGKVYFENSDNTTAGEVWLGNVPSFSITNDVTTKDHFKSWGGQRTKDYSVITQVGGTIDFTIDEVTEEGLAMFALGTLATEQTTDGGYDITGLTNTRFTGILHVVGDNDNGPTIEWIGKVSLQPSGQLFLIQDNDDWNKIPIKATIEQDDTYGLGKWTWHPNT